MADVSVEIVPYDGSPVVAFEEPIPWNALRLEGDQAVYFVAEHADGIAELRYQAPGGPSQRIDERVTSADGRDGLFVDPEDPYDVYYSVRDGERSGVYRIRLPR
jgi:hypothetical protein